MEKQTHFHENAVQWIGIRFLDTNSRTFCYEDKYYKAILPTAEAYVKHESYDLLLNSLYEEKFIPKTELTQFHIDGTIKIYEQYTEYFNPKLKYSNPFLLKEAALLYIKMNLWLYERGFVIHDGHAANIVVQKLNEPFWCDIGSIKKITNHNEFSGIDEFIRYFIYPLLLRSKSYSLGNMMRWSTTQGISHEVAASLDLVTKKFSLHGSRGNIFHTLEDVVNAIEFPWEKTLWSDYGMKVDLDTSIPDIVQGGHNRKAMVMRLLKTLAPKTVIDLGANAGSFSRLAASLGAEVLALEPDETAIARGHMHLREFGADNSIKFVTSDLFEMHQAADVAIALALTHHVFLTNLYPWSHIAKTLACHTNKHLIAEFMPNGLGTTQKQENLPAEYSLKKFVEQLKKHFASVEVIDYLSLQKASPRILLLCMNKKTC